ncbi:MAG TPA: toprim domain-containing protein, partial [Thermomonospora sp.]|nr:toprim domain-containing protein [Thermomonospora sp.]
MPAVVPPPAARTVNVLRGMAEQEISRLLDGTRPWTWWLGHAARHGRYGFTNTVLIAAQWRMATDVRSYEEWKAAGRHVRKGETGIRVLSREGRSRAAFDISQTDGHPIDTAPPALAVAGERLRQAAYSFGVRADQDAPATHDALTALALRLGQSLLPRHMTSVAYLVLAHLGLPTSHLVFPRVAAWAKDAGAVVAAGDRILEAASAVIAKLTLAESVRACLHEAHRFFVAHAAGSWVPGHLAERGLGPSVLARWEVGYAPDDWQALTGRLRALGYDEEAIVAAGLARRGRGGAPHDLFRDRAMLAIREPGGAVAGFIGRRRDGTEGPRYLNSPESAIFRKGRLLYGLHEIRGRLAQGARPVIVEGPFDALAVNTAVPDALAAVAICGPAVSAAHLAALGEAADLARTGVLLAPDGDRAGRAAAVRAWDVLAGVPGPVDV